MWSPSSRRAWIEINPDDLYKLLTVVALLAEGVDRNIQQTFEATPLSGVALLAEGVDRNFCSDLMHRTAYRSPSSRRAWIEICPTTSPPTGTRSRPPRGGRG